MKIVAVNQALLELRKRLEDEYKTKELSFYTQPLAGKWKRLDDEIVGLIACDSLEWKDEATEELKTHETCV
jgi:hypothetical protein